MQLYGQPEAPNIITRLRREDHRLDPGGEQRLTSCGQPAIMTAVKVVDEHGRELPRGQVGEIAASTPDATVGYRGRLEQTAKALGGRLVAHRRHRAHGRRQLRLPARPKKTI
ncbi:AMP-binding protein [Frankia sp. Mgl5]|uniref:AMP-binding protein n=1 Tax=Frankia sp. Mgl5 TaxID=2933793 RepID=UPI00200C3465|nr:AMP-binding protein [Frankia sp. Mgl5]MCK9930695.1 AMP-binding protein [Frankia sp. Mgl5]